MKHILSITFLCLSVSFVHAANEAVSVGLKFIHRDDVISVLGSLVDENVSISVKDNNLFINGDVDKVNNLLEIVKQIDSPPAPLTIEFIASSHKIDFTKSDNKTYQSSRNRGNVSQSMAITERQWVTLNTGLSIPITERKKYADGTETQSFHYQKISKSYVFKVHEFSEWSVIQVGMDASSISTSVSGAIQHIKLDTTIVGKTGEWLEVASSKNILPDENNKKYTTTSRDKDYIHLYVKVITSTDKGHTKETK